MAPALLNLRTDRMDTRPSPESSFLVGRDQVSEPQLCADGPKTFRLAAMFRQKSVSLGADAYRRIVEAAGLILDDEDDDEGQNHYYFVRKSNSSEGGD